MNGILHKSIELKFVSNLEMLKGEVYLKDIEDILVSTNNDFIPSLYERIEYDGTLREKIRFMINEKLEQGYHYILALDVDGKVIGFTDVKIGEDLVCNQNVYSIGVGTSAVYKEYQGKGIAKMLYEFLDNLAMENNVDVVTRRTWSLNERQLKLYEKFGYKEFERIPNLRGEGIDGVYFCKWFNSISLSS